MSIFHFFTILVFAFAGAVLSMVSTPGCIMALAVAALLGLDRLISAIKERK